MTKNKHNLNHILSVILSISFGILFAVFTLGKFVYGDDRKNFQDIGGINVIDFSVIHSVIGFLTFYLLYEFCFWVFRKEWKNRIKHIAALFGTVCAAMLLSIIFSVITLQIFTAPDNLHNHFFHITTIRGIMASVVVFLSTLYISTINRNQQTLLENQRLVAENIRNRYEALKNQLNPHFLFNSLNTLDGLMDFDIDKAHAYLQNLSSTFRYTMQNKEITTLKDELQFVECYAYLMKIRYGDKLNIEYAIDEKYNLYLVMPVTLQLLIENAIKHNVVNSKYPLIIRIETTENETIKVSNIIQPKNDVEAGEGIGLANLVERYYLLFGMSVVITKDSIFAVEIPLINKL